MTERPVARRRAWRVRAHELAVRVRPYILLGGAALVLVLGYVGFGHTMVNGKPAQLTWDDKLYRSIQLFGYSGGNVDPKVPIELRFGRIIGPLLVGYAAISGLLLLFRQQAQFLRIRLTMRDHVVVVGLGEIGSRLLFALYDAGLRVVAVERDRVNPRIEGCWERGIPVLIGDATDRDVLARARPSLAGRVVVTCGGDAVNVDVASAVAELLEPSASPLPVAVQLDDPDLWRLLRADALTRAADDPVRLEFFSVFRTAAAALLAAHPPGHDAVVVGADGVFGGAVAAEVARQAALGGDPRCRLALAGPGASQARERLVARWPGAASACELDAVDGDPVAAVGRLEAPARVHTVYVCLADESEGVAAGLHLAALDALESADVVVAVKDASAGVARALDAEVTGRHLHAFGVLERALTTQLVLDADVEILARAAHERYLGAERAAGHTRRDNPSAVPWQALPEPLRESNRRFAQSVGRKLRAARCTLVPLELGDPTADGMRFADDEIEALAREEHERWMTDLRRDGWRPTTGGKDPQRRLHPKFVPWNELSEEEREKDRGPIRELPAMLARLGYRIDRPGSSD